MPQHRAVEIQEYYHQPPHTWCSYLIVCLMKTSWCPDQTKAFTQAKSSQPLQYNCTLDRLLTSIWGAGQKKITWLTQLLVKSWMHFYLRYEEQSISRLHSRVHLVRDAWKLYQNSSCINVRYLLKQLIQLGDKLRVID